jgi:predicted DNA-binding transcriptional regulator AlpA
MKPAKSILPPREDALLRIWDILGSKKRGVPARIPVGRTTWYEGIRTGRFPKGVRIGVATMWREADIAEWIAQNSGRTDSARSGGRRHG